MATRCDAARTDRAKGCLTQFAENPAVRAYGPELPVGGYGPMDSKAMSPLKGKPLRIPGQSLDEQIQSIVDDKVLTYLWYVGGFALIAVMEWIGYLTNSPRRPWLYTCLFVAALAYAAWKIIPLRREVQALRLGRDGERAVGQYLERLRTSGAHILHDLPGDGFNLDHVVISDRGIFVIETKTWSKPKGDAKIGLQDGELTVAGRKPDRDPVRQVQAQMAWLARTLEEMTGKKWPVRGALVFPGWFVAPDLRNAFEGMWVLEPKALPSFIAHEPVRLQRSDVYLANSCLARWIRSAG